MKPWKYLPTNVYQSWVADKFARTAKQKVESILDQTADTVGAGVSAVGRGLDAFERNITDPIAGYGQAVGVTSGNVARSMLPGLDAGLSAYEMFSGKKSVLPRRTADLNVGSPSAMGEKFRDTEMSGLERFSTRTMADPTSYIGGYGKAIGKAGFGRVGALVSGVESLPGRAVDAGLGGAGSAVKSILPDALSQPSIRSQARAAAGETFDAVRNSSTPLQMSFDDVGQAAPDTGTRIRAATDAAAKTFDEKVKELRGVIKSRREQEMAGGGLSGVKARVQEGFDSAWNKGFDIPGTGVKVNPAGIQRGMSMAALNTPAYLAGNVLEDSARAARKGSVGAMGVEEFDEATRGVAGVPKELFGKGGQVAEAIGATKAGNKVGNALRSGFIDKAEEATAPIRRKFFADQIEAGLKQGLSQEEAGRVALQAFKREFPNYLDESQLDAAVKYVLPFWGYQKQRFPYLARVAAGNPGTVTGYERYGDEAKDNNIPLKGIGLPDFEVNPLKGTVAGGVDNLSKEDFPTFTQGASGRIERAMQQAGKFGFFPGSAAQLAAFGAAKLEGQPADLGALLPAPATVPLQALAATGAHTDIPGLENFAQAAGALEGAINNDRFRSYYINKELAAMGINPEDATPEQRAEATQRTAMRQGALTMGGFLRWRPQAEQDFREGQLDAAIKAGVPEDVARQANKKGNPLSAKDAAGNFLLTAAQKREVYEGNPDWEKWRNVNEPLKSEGERTASRATNGYFERLDQIDQETEQKLTELYTRFNDPQSAMSGDMFREQRSKIMADARAQRKDAEAVFGGQGALVNKEAREQFYAASGRELGGDNPLDVAARGYYELTPETDPATGEPKWEEFFAAREQALGGMDERTRQYVTEQFPRQKYKDNPVVAEGEATYQRDMDAFKQYMDMPKYRGLTKDQSDELDAALRLAAGIREQYPMMESDQVTALVARKYPRGVGLMRHVGLLRDPAREQFLAAPERKGARRLFSGTAPRELFGVIS